MSYNSYLIEDEQLCLLDTVDARKQDEWLGGLNEALDGRKLDYLVISAYGAGSYRGNLRRSARVNRR